MAKTTTKKQTTQKKSTPNVTVKREPTEEVIKMKDDVIDVAYGRVLQVANDFPELKREDFKSDAEYTKAVQGQYLALRQQEYEYICMQQAYDTYAASRCLDDVGCRTIMFSAVTGLPKEAYVVEEDDEPSIDKMSANSLEFGYKIYEYGDSSTVVNNAGREVYSIHQTNETKSTSTSHHCAMTGLRNVKGISERLGYTGSTCFTYGAGAGANAGLIHGRNAGTGRIQKNGAICGGKYSVAVKGKTLKELILSGEIGLGDIISTGKDNGSGNPNKVHGYHTLTVASINRDENGKIVGYTLMDNNGGDTKTRLEAHDINDNFGRNQVLYTKTHVWANDMFAKEVKGKSAEELQKMISQTKVRLCENVIPDLTRNEITIMCDETYLNTCGKTIKGVNRAPGLKNQQKAFRKFYYKQNNNLMEAGRKFCSESKEEVKVSENNNREVIAASLRVDAKRSAAVDLSEKLTEYLNEGTCFNLNKAYSQNITFQNNTGKEL